MRPLDDVAIVDLTRLLPGAFATLMLADMGARVIKVEDPRGGDTIRQFPPFVDGESVYHRVLNRNKQSVAVDLRSARGLAVLHALLPKADVLVEGFRPHVARRLGVSAPQLRDGRPRLIHCSITGFGQGGPYAERAGHDVNYMALAGLLDVARASPTEAPKMPRMFVADIGGGAMSAVTGILAALFARERTGVGSAVDVSMHEGALSWLTAPAAAVLAGGSQMTGDLPTTGQAACYNIYETADGRHVALGALEPKFWARFCARIERPDFIPLQFASGAEQDRVHRLVTQVMRSRTRDEWLADFDDADACLTPVYTVGEALEDPHVRARAAVERSGSQRFIRPPVRFGGGTGPFPREFQPAPALGADTDEVLESCGIDAATRAQLRDGEIIA
ncbi:MAG: CoA transferase [Acidobacteria bacterium]|nr:CoA transferase [Acidobacteriota bacterium]